jgi:hypothetical protein
MSWQCARARSWNGLLSAQALTGVDEVHSAWHCAIDARMASDYLRVFDGRLEFSEVKVIMLPHHFASAIRDVIV